MSENNMQAAAEQTMEQLVYTMINEEVESSFLPWSLSAADIIGFYAVLVPLMKLKVSEQYTVDINLKIEAEERRIEMHLRQKRQSNRRLLTIGSIR